MRHQPGWRSSAGAGRDRSAELGAIERGAHVRVLPRVAAVVDPIDSGRGRSNVAAACARRLDGIAAARAREGFVHGKAFREVGGFIARHYLRRYFGRFRCNLSRALPGACAHARAHART